MAWKCIKCDRRIFAPREDSHGYAMVWRWNPKTRDITCDVERLHEISDNAVVTHVICQHPAESGFTPRMKKALKMPKKAFHPLLPENINDD